MARTHPSGSPHGAVASPHAGAGAALALIGFLAISGPALHAGESDLTVEIGLGYDDNPFETPSDPYFDQFDLVTVDPEKSPGFYVPVSLAGGYRMPGEKHRFLLDYILRHDAYGSGNSNANETYCRLAPGYEMRVSRPGGRWDRFFAVPYATYRKEIFFDRDTGVGEVVGFEDASQRYTYLAAGAETGFSSEIGRKVAWGVDGQYELRNYEDVETVSSLDHNRLQIGANLRADLSPRLRYYLDYAYRILDYDERPSRDLDGGITANETPVLYRYHVVGNTLRFEPSAPWTLYFDLDYTRRIDRFAGYNDYHMPGARVRALWRSGSKLVRVAVRYQHRSYPRAFIFDKEENPATLDANPNKDYDILETTIRFETPMVRSAIFFTEAEILRQDAADPRFTYDNLRVAAGVKWAFEWSTE